MEKINPDSLKSFLAEEAFLDQDDPEEEQADFESGFTGDYPKEPEKEPDEDPKEDIEEEEKAEDTVVSEEKEDEPDPFEKYEKRIRNIEGKYGTLNSQYQQLLKSNEKVDKPDRDQIKEAMQSGEKFIALKEEFPEYAEVLEEQMDIFNKNMPDSDNITTDVLSSVTNMIVEMKHRNWQETVKTDDFSSWFKDQGEDVKSLSESDHPSDAIKLLDEYEQSVSEKSDAKKEEKAKEIQSKKRLEAAVPATKSTTRSTPIESEDDDFQAGFYGT